MLESRQEIWKKFDELNISKIIILYTAKYKKKINVLLIDIESTFALLKNGEQSLSWQSILSDDKPYILEALKKEHADLQGKVSGMLVYDNIKNKIILSGNYKKTIIEKFQKEL